MARATQMAENSAFVSIDTKSLRKVDVTSFRAHFKPPMHKPFKNLITVKQYEQKEDEALCKEWKESGECENNPGGMIDHGQCTYTCMCIDRNPACPQWAAEVQCRTNPIPLEQQCQYSCN